MITTGENDMFVPDFWPARYSRIDFDLHHTQRILHTGIEKNSTVIGPWHPHQVIYLLFASGTILWCDSQHGVVSIAKAIFQGWKPTSGYNNRSLEKGGGICPYQTTTSGWLYKCLLHY